MAPGTATDTDYFAEGAPWGAQVEQLADPALPVAQIVARCPARLLMEIYRVPAFAGPDEFLAAVAAARGKLRKGGVADTLVRALAHAAASVS